LQSPVVAFASVCLFLLAVPLVVAAVTTVGERIRRIRTRPGFEVKLIAELPVLPVVSVLPKKEDDHG